MRVLWYLVPTFHSDEQIELAAAQAVKEDSYLTKGSVWVRTGKMSEVVQFEFHEGKPSFSMVFFAKDFQTLQLGLKHYAEKVKDVVFHGKPQLVMRYGRYGEPTGPTSTLGVYAQSKKYESDNVQKLNYIRAIVSTEPTQRGRSGANAPSWTREYSDLHNPSKPLSLSQSYELAKITRSMNSSDELANAGVYVLIGCYGSGGGIKNRSELYIDSLLGTTLSMTELAYWISWKKDKYQDNSL